MQLEKATSQSGHAALAGWISSNDVTLFTTVLVMAIAIFLAAKLTTAVEDNVQATAARDALATRLDVVSGELQKSVATATDLRDQLNSSRAERQQLQLKLDMKVEILADLNTKLEALLSEKHELASQGQSLLAANESLSKEKEALSKRYTTVTTERESLNAENANLHRELDALASKLADKIGALEQMEVERNRLKKQADKLELVIAKLKQQSDTLNANLADLEATTTEKQAKATLRVTDLEAQLADQNKTIEDYVATLARTTEELQRLTAQKRDLQQAISKSELRHQAELLEQGRNNRELVGLTGNLKRVVVLFDASGSMRQKESDGSDRWAEAQEIAAKWLQHVNVEQCALIVFSSTVHIFPENGALADVRGESGKAKRDSLLRRVKTVTPSGGTNTYEALRKAYDYDIDAILLFSDGAPSSSTTGAFDPAAANQIYKLCRAHPNIPIHTIGLGNYFDQKASSFLISVARITGGTFRGL